MTNDTKPTTLLEADFGIGEDPAFEAEMRRTAEAEHNRRMQDARLRKALDDSNAEVAEMLRQLQ